MDLDKFLFFFIIILLFYFLPMDNSTDKAAPQAGVFSGLNPTLVNPADPVVLFIIQVYINIHTSLLTRFTCNV